MKVNELMVGDWVICNHYQDKPFTKQLGVADFAKGEYEFCEPIPLTEDILLKNGFVKDGNGDYEINDGVVVVMDWKGKSEHFACAPYEVEDCFGQYHYLYVELFECKYVHQLQHLLRLCGIEKGIEL